MIQSKRVRVRFAPSPTGSLHIGGLRTALYNYLFAKHHAGDFILRIEDTDQARQVAGAVEQLLRVMHIFNLTPDEGPQLTDEGTVEEYGSYGPYTQSRRTDRYREVANKLLALQHAYYCFCTPHRLTQLRTIQQKKKLPPMYDGHCRALSPNETAERLKKHDAHVLRLKIPKTGSLSVKDLVRGHVDFSYKLVDDQVLIKSDGYPTYHLANVVDDHDMNITHVIRGEEWLPSVPKHLFLYNALNWEAPQMAHLPILLDEKGGKLSKRSGAASVETYITDGIMPEALLNFLLLLGWNPKNDKEFFSREEMINVFSLKNVHAAAATVNKKKLLWMNRHYIEQMPPQELYAYAVTHNFLDSTYVQQVTNSSAWMDFLSLVKSRLTDLRELQNSVDYYITDPDVERTLLDAKSSKTSTQHILRKVYAVLEQLSTWKGNAIQEAVESLIKANDWKRGEVLWPIRVALTGKRFSPGTYELLEIFGRSVVLRRIAHAMKV